MKFQGRVLDPPSGVFGLPLLAHASGLRTITGRTRVFCIRYLGPDCLDFELQATAHAHTCTLQASHMAHITRMSYMRRHSSICHANIGADVPDLQEVVVIPTTEPMARPLECGGGTGGFISLMRNDALIAMHHLGCCLICVKPLVLVGVGAFRASLLVLGGATSLDARSASYRVGAA